MFISYVDLLFNLPLRQSYTYQVPEEFLDKVKVGIRVQVKFGERTKLCTAIIESIHKIEKAEKILPIIKLIDPEPLINAEQIALAYWISENYLCSTGEALFIMFPKGKEVKRISPKAQGETKIIYELNSSQKAIYKKIKNDLKKKSQRKKPPIHLLHGITGSGKTEIYIHLIHNAISLNYTALLLVPEISLTVQLIQRLEQVFINQLALLHSGLKPKQRFQSYLEIIRKEKKIVIGTRSAVFAPLTNIGLIIIDEEHDSSFKENSTPRYDARQIALKRAESHNASLVLGSATPRLETTYYARNSLMSFTYHSLTHRAKGQGLPEVYLAKVDSPDSIIGDKLLAELDENIKRKEQSILLLNRRGYFPQVYCLESKTVELCPSCAVSLNLHRNGQLKCHYCGYQRHYDGFASDGGETRLVGTGTQKLEDFLLHKFPEVRIERLDSDIIDKQNVLKDTLLRFIGGEIDILIGTQVIARGLDAPRVSLVGVLQAEKGLYLPDFRATEKTFSLLTQVAGRAGRSNIKGRVIFECYNPQNPVIQAAALHNYEKFYQMDIPFRKATFYPPFSRLVRLVCRGIEQKRIQNFMQKLGLLIEERFQDEAKDSQRIEILGPAPASIEKIHNKFREHILIKTNSMQTVRKILKEILFEKSELTTHALDYLEIDLDPLDMM